MFTARTVVANNWADLTDGTLAGAINRDELGMLRSSHTWTNTLVSGAADNSFASTFSDSCADWSSTLAGSGRNGLSTADSTWTQGGTMECPGALAFYCFQQ